MTFARYLKVLTGLDAPEGAMAVATLAGVAAVNLLGVRAGSSSAYRASSFSTSPSRGSPSASSARPASR